MNKQKLLEKRLSDLKRKATVLKSNVEDLDRETMEFLEMLEKKKC